jgi:hypothetical protein
MRDAIVRCRHWSIAAAAIAILGCSDDTAKNARSVAADAAASSSADERHELRSTGTLRVRRDIARNRVWVLGLDEIRLYDLAHRRLMRRIELPGWSVIADLCMPDMAVTPSGAVIVSSNAQPTLWWIDAGGFEVRAYDIRLHGREGWSIGFGALRFDAAGHLFALTASANSMWQIDLAAATARELEFYSPPKESCELGSALNAAAVRVE